MRTFLLLVTTGIVLVQSAEWTTSKGYHCIEKCTVGVKAAFDHPVYWCPAVDGVSTIHTPQATGQSGRPEAHEGDNTVPAEDRLLWDYCTPAPVASLQGGGEDTHYEEAVNLPARVNRTKRQSGSGGFNPGTGPSFSGKVASSLPDVDCEGECLENRGGRFNCDVPGTDPNNFFCSPNTALTREQLTSQNKLWCTGPCIKQPGADYYQCKTLFGYDNCSPQSDRSSQGDLCTSSCQPNLDVNPGHHYQCSTAEDGSSKEEDAVRFDEDCGYWHVENSQKMALEYTVDDQVCAGPCVATEGGLVCEYVSWQWDQNQGSANLLLNLGSCDHEGGWSWTTIGLIIGGIVGGLFIIGVVAFFVSRSQYQRAASIDH